MDEPDRPSKRAKLLATATKPEVSDEGHAPSHDDSTDLIKPLASLHRSITPPLSSRSLRDPARPPPAHDSSISSSSSKAQQPCSLDQKVLPSPIQLTHIRDFPPSSGNNVDTVRLRDILGDPLIRECWQFNYLHDVDFLMSQFDEDVRALVKLKVVHGSWKREAPNRVRIDVCFCPSRISDPRESQLTNTTHHLRKHAHDIPMSRQSWPTCPKPSGPITPR